MKTGFFKTLNNQRKIIFSSRFLASLKKTEAYEFIQLCHKRTFQPGEYIYHQNDPGNGMYILESGSVELIIEQGQKQDISTDEVPSIMIDPPECFGNLSLAYEMRRMSSARAVTEVEALGFYNSDLETLQKRYPQIAIKIMSEINRTLARQLEITVRALSEVSGESNAYKLQFDHYYSKNEPGHDLA